LPRHHLVTNASIYSVRPVVTQHHVQVITEAKPPKSDELGPFDEVSIYAERQVIIERRGRTIEETSPSNVSRSPIYYVLMSVALLLWLPPLLAVGRMIFETMPQPEKMPCILISCAILFVAGTLVGNFALRFAPCR
jgi:hypothetical protein